MCTLNGEYYTMEMYNRYISVVPPPTHTQLVSNFLFHFQGMITKKDNIKFKKKKKTM